MPIRLSTNSIFVLNDDAIVSPTKNTVINEYIISIIDTTVFQPLLVTAPLESHKSFFMMTTPSFFSQTD